MSQQFWLWGKQQIAATLTAAILLQWEAGTSLKSVLPKEDLVSPAVYLNDGD